MKRNDPLKANKLKHSPAKDKVRFVSGSLKANPNKSMSGDFSQTLEYALRLLEESSEKT